MDDLLRAGVCVSTAWPASAMTTSRPVKARVRAIPQIGQLSPRRREADNAGPDHQAIDIMHTGADDNIESR